MFCNVSFLCEIFRAAAGFKLLPVMKKDRGCNFEDLRLFDTLRKAQELSYLSTFFSKICIICVPIVVSPSKLSSPIHILTIDIIYVNKQLYYLCNNSRSTTHYHSTNIFNSTTLTSYSDPVVRNVFLLYKTSIFSYSIYLFDLLYVATLQLSFYF